MDVKKLWWSPVIRGVIAVLFGLFALFWPGITVFALVILFAAYVLMDGVMGLVGAFTNREAAGGSRFLYGLMGVAGIAIGFMAIFWPAITAVALAWVIAFWAVITGVLEIAASFSAKSVTGQFGWLALLSGVLSVILGVVIMFQPAAGAVALVYLIGALAIAWGITLLVAGFDLRGLTKDLTDRTGEMPGGTAHPTGA